MTKKILATLCVAPMAFSAAAVEAPEGADTALTIYSSAQAGSILRSNIATAAKGKAYPATR